MNFLFVFTHEFESSNLVCLQQQRAKRTYSLIPNLREGDKIKLCLEDVGQTTGIVREIKDERLKVLISEISRKIVSPKINCVVGLSRPQTVKKVLELSGAFGVQNIHFVSSKLGEKSYLNSNVFQRYKVEESILKGLEQSGACFIPKVHRHPHVKGFLSQYFPKDKTTEWGNTSKLILGDQEGSISIGQFATQENFDRIWLVVGPEPGWDSSEKEDFMCRGFKPTSLGFPLMLRVEHALAGFLTQLCRYD